MFQPENQIEDLLLSITKKCETLMKKTLRTPEETLELKMIEPRETFYFNPPIHGKGDWMTRLTGLEVYNSLFYIKKRK